MGNEISTSISPAELERISEFIANAVAKKLANRARLVDRVALSQQIGLSVPTIDRRRKDGCAEWNCFLSLGWQLPVRILDLWCEFKNMLNGTQPPAGFGLLGCLAYHGLDSIAATHQ